MLPPKKGSKGISPLSSLIDSVIRPPGMHTQITPDTGGGPSSIEANPAPFGRRPKATAPADPPPAPPRRGKAAKPDGG